MARILAVDSDPHYIGAYSEALDTHDLYSAIDSDEALRHLAGIRVDLIITDYELLRSNIDFINYAGNKKVIVTTPYESPQGLEEALSELRGRIPFEHFQKPSKPAVAGLERGEIIKRLAQGLSPGLPRLVNEMLANR